MKKRAIIIALISIACVLVILLGGVFGALLAVRHTGKLEMEKRRQDEATKSNFEDYEFDPSIIHYNGGIYKYNDDLTSILFLGIDKDEHLEKESEGIGDAGQCDVILLVVLNEKAKKADIIAIDRNTMTDIESFDESGNFIGNLSSQVALSYAYGDGKQSSCELSKTAISDLLFEIPIHAYYSMAVSAVADVTDAVGGVPVTIPVDMTTTHETFAEGETVTLTGETAMLFLRARTGLEDTSNAARISRQKQYIVSLISQTKSAILKNVSVVSDLYEKITDKSCTDISLSEAVYLASMLPDLEINFRGITGTTVQGESFDEFYPDETALYELVLDIFYNKLN